MVTSSAQLLCCPSVGGEMLFLQFKNVYPVYATMENKAEKNQRTTGQANSFSSDFSACLSI